MRVFTSHTHVTLFGKCRWGVGSKPCPVNPWSMGKHAALHTNAHLPGCVCQYDECLRRLGGREAGARGGRGGGGSRGMTFLFMLL